VSAIHCDLETGRTHQIRVHCAHIRHPLLGDPVYGHARGKRSVQPLPNEFGRQALHAWRLGLIHPTTGRDISWRADVPDDIEELAAALGLGRDEATDLDPEDADFVDEDDHAGRARAWDESQPIEYDEDDEE
jgi:23S rRNA pseudouridine1911/1915/1917 synthase